MDLNEARNLLPLMADGELDEPRRSEVAAWLERSTELRSELDRWRRLRACCGRAVCGEPVPAALPQRVQACLQPAGAPRSRLMRLWPALAAAAVLAVGGYFGTVLLRPGPGSPAGVAYAGVIDSGALARIHRGCGEGHHDSFDLSAHADRLRYARAEVQRRMGLPPAAVPDFSGAGFELDGCCACLEHVVRNVKGMRAVHVSYTESSGARRTVSFFAIAPCVSVAGGRPCDGGAGPGPSGRFEAVTSGDVVLVKWSCKERTYAVAGRLSPEELRGLARRVEAAVGTRSEFRVASSE